MVDLESLGLPRSLRPGSADFTDPTNPVIVDQYIDGANVWEVWHYNGWLFTGDRGRGLDTLRLVWTRTMG